MNQALINDGYEFQGTESSSADIYERPFYGAFDSQLVYGVERVADFDDHQHASVVVTDGIVYLGNQWLRISGIATGWTPEVPALHDAAFENTSPVENLWSEVLSILGNYYPNDDDAGEAFAGCCCFTAQRALKSALSSPTMGTPEAAALARAKTWGELKNAHAMILAAAA